MKHFQITCVPALAVLAFGCAASPDRSVSSPAQPDPGSVSVSSPTTAATSCSQDIALDCADGVDGCLQNRTTVHVCVATMASVGPSCSQEIALECSAGETDACLVTPAMAANHICVRA